MKKKKSSVRMHGIFGSFLISLLMLLILMTCFTSMTSYAQQSTLTVKGKVTDSSTGEPLPGVNIIIKGSTMGEVTDASGNYSIKVFATQCVLQYSFIGYVTQEVSVGSRQTINVALEQDMTEVDPVVVIGYGTVRKSDLTGSVSSVTKDVVSDRVVTSLEDAIKGRASGLQIVENDGTPGSESTIRIRGASSVNASSSPIYVVDGVIMENVFDLSPGDIESIEILKDASSAAIYGSRGSNGVIIVTTKSGSDKRFKVDFYNLTGLQTITRPYDMLNAMEYARYRLQATMSYYKHDAVTEAMLADQDYIYYKDQPGESANYWRVSADNPYLDWEAYSSPDTTNTDWQKVMFRTARVSEYRLNLSGKTDASNFSFMVNYLDQEGIIINSGFKKFSGRLNYVQDLTKNLRFTTNISLSRVKYDGIASKDSYGVTTSMLRQSPLLPFTENDVVLSDDATELFVSSNPYYQANHITMNKYRNNTMVRSVLDYTISKNLSLLITGNYNYTQTTSETFYPATVQQGVKQGGRGIVNIGTTQNMMNENLLYYKGKIGKEHVIKIMGGAIFEATRYKGLNVENQDFPSINLGVDQLGLGTTPVIPTTPQYYWTMASFLGRLEYSYLNRYLFTTTFRADGSSRFAENNKWGYFPSAAFAWKAVEEDFIKNLNVFSELKLRLSAGITGNTAISSYQSLSTMTTAFSPMSGSDPYYGLVVDGPANADLKWESTYQYNLGLDIGIMDNRIRLTVDSYLKRTHDLLLKKEVPRYTGFETAWSNVGSIQNKGIEFTLGAGIISTVKFKWNSEFNIGLNRSKVLDLGEQSEMSFDPGVLPGSGNFVILREGESLGQWYGYVVDGVWASQAEIDESPIESVFSIQKANLRPGDHKWVDISGPDGVPDNKITSDDRVVLGKGEPLFTGGFYNYLSYEGFGLGFLFQFSYGADIFNANLATLDAGSSYNQTSHITNSFSPTLYTLDDQLYDPGNPTGKYRMPGGVAENYCLSEFILDGSFIRLSDVTLSYEFKKSLLNKIKIEDLRVFITGKNLLLFTKYFGYDPEVNTRQGTTGDLMPGLDFGSYPKARTISAGVNVTF